MSKEVRTAETRLARAIRASNRVGANGEAVSEAISALIDAKISEKKIQFLKEEGSVLLEYGK